MIKPPLQPPSQPIGAYDLFELMNLTQMPQSQKDSYLLDANVLIWQKFLIEKLPHLITQDQYKVLQQQLNEGKSFDSVMEWLLDLVPNLSYLLGEFTSEAKATLIQSHFTSELANLEKMLSPELSEENTNLIKSKITNYRTALRLAFQEDWQQIIELWQ